MSDLDKHAVLSPSGAAGWLVCVGKPGMEKGLTEGPKEDRDMGTCAHAVAAMALTENRPASAYIGRRIEVGPHRTFEFTRDMGEPTQCYVDLVLETVEAYKAAGAAHVELHIEQRVPVGQFTGEEGAEGTADAVILAHLADDLEVCVIDLKFGKGVAVSAEKNPQLLLYGLGAIAKHDALGEAKRLRVMISQPRIAEAPSDWSVDVAELEDFKLQVATKGREALDIYEGKVYADGPVGLRAGEHCRKSFCKARATCPAYAKVVTDNVGADFEVIAGSEVKAVDALTHQLVKAPDAEADLALKMRACDLIEDWVRAVRAEVERRLLAGTAVPGFKLVQGRAGARKWASEAEAEAQMKSFRMKVEEMYDMSVISPTTAEKRLKKEHPRQWTKLQPIITRSEGKPSVAPTEDPRPALEVKPVSDDFNVVNTEDVL